MLILKDYAAAELTVKNSRFLAELFPCKKQDDARAIVKSQKNKYRDARHVVHAFVLGLNAEVLGSSDDGEPSGTAGRPVLDILKGFGATNLVLTVTRWFGGTLLGTGGLVKAYGDSAKAVLAAASEQNLFEEYVPMANFSFNCEYAAYQSIKRRLSDFAVSELSEQFTETVHVSGTVPESQKKALADFLQNASNGQIQLT